MATEVKKPTAFTDGSTIWSNEGQAYDTVTAGDETTYADSIMSGDFDPSLLLYTWGIKGQTYTATVLKVKWDCLVAQDDDVWGIQYTKDGGSNWYDLLASGNNSSAVIVAEQVSLDANQDLTLVQVKVTSVQNKGADGHTVRIYDVWTEGEYTAGATTYYQNTGQGAVAQIGSLSKKTTPVASMGGHVMSIVGLLSKKTTPNAAMGNHAMAIEGNLSTAIVVGQIVGGHALIIAGTLTMAATFVRAIGGYAVTIIGVLIKKTSTGVGGGQVSPIGVLSKKTSKDVGGGSVTSAGTLTIAIMYMQAVGGASMSIAGSLATQFIAGVEGVAKFIRRRKTFYKH